MIARIQGQLVEKKENALILRVHQVCYEVWVPRFVLQRIDEVVDKDGCLELVTYNYLHVTQSSALPVLVGFINEIERDFFLQFITVSGIGPRAAIKALDRSISEITGAIDQGDIKFLTLLPGIGPQRAKEIVAKLQGKLGKFGLIKEQKKGTKVFESISDWQKEALHVLLQLEYKRNEAEEMIQRALQQNTSLSTTEELLNQIYKQRVKKA